ncbi:MAG: amino acid racemase [Bacteroidota bacterium]
MAKKKLGILGGMGSRAASMLFSKIVDYSPATKDQDFIEILLHNNSAIPDRTRAIVYQEESPLEEVLRSIKIFNENEVDVVILACITSYYFYEEIKRHANAEILHPVKLMKEHLLNHYPDIRKAGVLATTGTLKTNLFQNEFQDSGIELVTLNPEDQENLFMRSVYMENGLKSSPISDTAVQLLFQTIPKLLNQHAEVIIGGCTEVQIVLKENMLSVPYVDAMDVTAKEAIRVCYGLHEYSSPISIEHES